MPYLKYLRNVRTEAPDLGEMDERFINFLLLGEKKIEKI